ncbi:MAG TPA: ABC transporter ATP-binding protein [Candidatus Saccharimonadales bacterium]|nr:ABC transporter ATP-binding protein [Candidatus Saccharimonadales bacterium]
MMNQSQKQKMKEILASAYHGDVQAFLDDLERELTTVEIQPKRTVAPGTPIIISLTNVSRTYRLNRKNTVNAVKDVSITVHEGEIVALTGPSGSGKSTLMHLIGGLDKPSSGTVQVDGASVGDMHEGSLARYRNEIVGFVFQFFYLQPFLRVSRNIELPLMFARTKRKTRASAIDAVVQSVGLGDRAAFLPKELSGGQMQRVAIARALVNEPKILLADEPTGNLDSKNSEAIMKLLQAIREARGTTMVIVTHDPRVAAWADRVIKLEDGQVVS